MITVKEISTKADLKKFVKFPFRLYKDNPYWVPPIISEELNAFNKDKNPAFQTASARFYLAYKDNQIAGRVAAIINETEINEQQIKKMRFGWFDVIDDINVTKALLQKVEEIGVQNNLAFVEGPVGFSNLDKVGILTEGFDKMGSMITWYNAPYYKEHIEKLGYVKEKELLESFFPFKDMSNLKFFKLQELIKKRYKLKALNFKTTAEVMNYADEMFDLFNISYANLSTFTPINDIQKQYFKEKYISFINPEYIKFVADEHNKLVAFAIVMPSFSKALQKAKGKLFPFGFYHLLKAKKHSKEVLFYLIGVHPDYQSKGVHSIIFKEFNKTFVEKGIKNCIRTPILEDNIAIQQIWKDFGVKPYKRRRTYRKNL